MRISKLLLFIASAGMLLIFCVEYAGNTSETGNAAIAGTLYEPDAGTPACGVEVTIRPKTSLAAIAAAPSAQQTISTDSVITDSMGRFAFNGIEAGEYVINAIRKNDGAMIEPVRVNEPGAGLVVADTLKPLGAIRGTIGLEGGGFPGSAIVLVFGVDRFTMVNQDGTFHLPFLAEGYYDIRVFPDTAQYGSFDITDVFVKPEDTTDVGFHEAPFTGIPQPKNLTLQYDTSRQMVTLRWDRCDTGRIKNYNVYRYNYYGGFDSAQNVFYSMVNNEPVTDTFFVDTGNCTGLLDYGNQFLQYCVTALDYNHNAGEKSAAVKVEMTTRFIRRDISLQGMMPSYLKRSDLTVSESGETYFISDSGMAVADTAGKVRLHSTRKYGFQPERISMDEEGNLFLARYDTSGIYRIDSTGLICDSIVDSILRCNGIFDVEAYEGVLYVLTGSSAKDPLSKLTASESHGGDIIAAYTYKGERLRAWKCSRINACKRINRCGSGNLVVINGDSSEYVTVFDTVGNVLSSFKMPYATSTVPGEKILRPVNVIYDDVRQLLYVHCKCENRRGRDPQAINFEIEKLIVFDDRLEYVAGYTVEASINSIGIGSGGEIVIGADNRLLYLKLTL